MYTDNLPPSFVTIPGFPEYTITPDAHVYIRKTGRVFPYLKNGYLYVTLKHPTKGPTGRGLHRLVAAAYFEWIYPHYPAPPKTIIKFRDGDKTNCCVTNLEVINLELSK